MDTSPSDNRYHRLFAYLLSLLPAAKNYVREERVSNEEIISGKPSAAWHLVHYCRLVRGFIRGQQEKAMFAQHHADLANLLVACDTNHYECDENKHEVSSCYHFSLVHFSFLPGGVALLS